MHRTTETLERRDGDREGLNEPSFRSILFGGLPGFFREGFLPLGAFYVGLRLSGLATGIALATLVSVLEYARERRAGRDGLLVRLSLAFVLVQSAVGLISDSTTVYLATPVVANGIWAAAFFGSVVLGRPLAGALASAWYPFSRSSGRRASSSESSASNRSSGASTCSHGAGCASPSCCMAASAASSSSRS